MTKTAFDEVKDKVVELIKVYDATNRDALIEVIKKDLSADKLTDEHKTFVLKRYETKAFFFFLILLLLPFLSLVLSIYFVDTFPSIDTDEKFKFYLPLLGFIVALASYLATVARESIKKSHTSTGEVRKNARANTFMVVTAEASLIMISLIVLIRLLVGNYEHTFSGLNWSFSFDALIISHLMVTLAWMACLHGRIWWIHKPWDINKQKSS